VRKKSGERIKQREDTDFMKSMTWSRKMLTDSASIVVCDMKLGRLTVRERSERSDDASPSVAFDSSPWHLPTTRTERTEQPQQMLRPIDLTRLELIAHPYRSTDVGLVFATLLDVLLAFEAVEEVRAEGLVKV
jgi:hypothetical protein